MVTRSESLRRLAATRLRATRFLAVGVGLCLCSAAYLRSLTPGAAWAQPPAATSRRAGAAALGAALLAGSGLAPQPAAAASYKPGQVRPPGQNDEVDYLSGRDSEEVGEQRRQARLAEQKRQVGLKEKFRGIFAEFAGEETAPARRTELLQDLTKFVDEEKGMLPTGITRDDVVKGVRAVKFNIGCIRDKVKKDLDCKPLEKAYMKLLNTIDKGSEKSMVR